MIVPTIGRVVLYHPAHPHTQPQPALVSYVHGNRCINIGGFDSNGTPFSACSLLLLQDDEVAPAGVAYAEWMPYQKKVAADSK